MNSDKIKGMWTVKMPRLKAIAPVTSKTIMTIGSRLCGLDRIIVESAMIIEPINTNARFLRLILKRISSFSMVR